MSVCDEGWEVGKLTGCPVAWYDSGGEAVGGCDLSANPDFCPHAAALRAVVEDPTLVLMAVPKDLTGGIYMNDKSEEAVILPETIRPIKEK